MAALSSCHMLTFLYLAQKQSFVVDSYDDDAVGVMTKNERGKLFVSQVTLRPRIVFSGAKRPSDAELVELHHHAHEECYIANSVLTEVVVEPAVAGMKGGSRLACCCRRGASSRMAAFAGYGPRHQLIVNSLAVGNEVPA